jgi:hypothetical protein
VNQLQLVMLLLTVYNYNIVYQCRAVDNDKVTDFFTVGQLLELLDLDYWNVSEREPGTVIKTVTHYSQ